MEPWSEELPRAPHRGPLRLNPTARVSCNLRTATGPARSESFAGNRVVHVSRYRFNLFLTPASPPLISNRTVAVRCRLLHARMAGLALGPVVSVGFCWVRVVRCCVRCMRWISLGPARQWQDFALLCALHGCVIPGARMSVTEFLFSLWLSTVNTFVSRIGDGVQYFEDIYPLISIH